MTRGCRTVGVRPSSSKAVDRRLATVPPIRVLQVMDRLNVGGPALLMAELSRGLDPDTVRAATPRRFGRRGGGRLRLAPRTRPPDRTRRRTRARTTRRSRRAGARPDQSRHPRVPAAHRAHAQGKGRRARPHGSVGPSCSLDRPHLPRSPADGILLTGEDASGRERRAGIRVEDDASGGSGRAGARRAPRRQGRPPRAVRRRATRHDVRVRAEPGGRPPRSRAAARRTRRLVRGSPHRSEAARAVRRRGGPHRC